MGRHKKFRKPFQLAFYIEQDDVVFLDQMKDMMGCQNRNDAVAKIIAKLQAMKKLYPGEFASLFGTGYTG